MKLLARVGWICVCIGVFAGCTTYQTAFRHRKVHDRYQPALCDPGALALTRPSDATVDVYEEGRRLRDVMDRCLVPEVRLDELELLCGYHRMYQRARMNDRKPEEADREAMKAIKESFDQYRDRVRDVSNRLRNAIQVLQQKSPQASMLYLLEARLYLLAGYALERHAYLDANADNEAAEEWYRKVIEKARKAQETNKSYGLAYLYEAEALARLGRFADAMTLVRKLHEAGYKSSSTHALMAFCAAGTGDEATLKNALAAAIDAANREEAAGWANRYKKYLDDRKDWEARMAAAKAREEFEVLLDDRALPVKPEARIELEGRMAAHLSSTCF
jgi:tetratricopeptide (TPR) repeat protein